MLAFKRVDRATEKQQEGQLSKPGKPQVQKKAASSLEAARRQLKVQESSQSGNKGTTEVNRPER